MAEESGAEKTEPASAKRLREARQSGDIPRSREVGTFAVLMTAGAALWMLGGGLFHKLSQVLAGGLSLNREQIYNPNVLIERVTTDIASVLLTCLPMLGDYFTNDLLSGSPSTSMVGNLINNTVLTPGQTGQAGAFVLLVLVVSLVPMIWYVRSTRAEGLAA